MVVIQFTCSEFSVGWLSRPQDRLKIGISQGQRASAPGRAVRAALRLPIVFSRARIGGIGGFQEVDIARTTRRVIEAMSLLCLFRLAFAPTLAPVATKGN
jgi:hypothetical protein